MKINGEEIRDILPGCFIKTDFVGRDWEGIVLFSIKDPNVGEYYICAKLSGGGETKSLRRNEFSVTKWVKPIHPFSG
jgi:hypothetical protein